MPGEELTLEFDPLTIEHLGYKMYSQLPNALAELIANSYDADARLVRVHIEEVSDQQAVTVEDNGHGMDLNDLNEKYLRIGRNRRRGGNVYSESGQRKVAGKKGLGKLALFGIGEVIELRTKRLNSYVTYNVRLDWAAIRQSTGAAYHPALSRFETAPELHGTTVRLANLRRKTPVDGRALAVSLGRLFHYLDDEFEIEVVDHPRGRRHRVDRKSRLDSIEKDKEWAVPGDLPDELRAMLPDPGITGRVVATSKPNASENRGITLYAHGRLANEPEFYGVAESSFAFNYLTGYLDVDYIDDEESDAISTDRRSIDWDNAQTQQLRAFLSRLLLWLSQERRKIRQQANSDRLNRDHGVNVDHWLGTIRGPEREPLRVAADVLTSPESNMADADRDRLLDSLQKIAPEYADLHWRHLHPRIREVSEQHYQLGLYHSALSEAMKRYIGDVRYVSDLSGNEDTHVVDIAFADKDPLVDVANPFVPLRFDERTLNGLRTGQHRLSAGVVAAFRDPITYEEEIRLTSNGLLSHQDCLDGLSILSHLYHRFEEALSGADQAALALFRLGRPNAG